METETKTEGGVVDTQNNEGEGEKNVEEALSIPKKEYDTMNQTIGSLKKELKDLRKAREEAKEETSKTNSKPDESLLQKAFLRAAQITAEDEVELALTTAKKWGMEVDKLVDDEDFKVKLEKLRTDKANVTATSNIRGSAGTTNAKNTKEYWEAKGTPPGPADVPDRATRTKIVKAMMASTKEGKKFYND